MANQTNSNRRPSRLLSLGRMLAISIVSSSLVLVVSLAIQWLIYDDWMHETGPLRIVGTCFAALLTFLFVYRWLLTVRRNENEMMRRFQTIAAMNDRIRNALQVIECTTYALAPDATEPVKSAVEVIDEALRGVVAEVSVVRPIALPPQSDAPARPRADANSA